MQSTVFDFAFNLRLVNSEFYILPSRYQLVKIDFKTALIREPFTDFGMASHFRMRDNNAISYLTIEDYCLDNSDECRAERSYLNGKHAYQDLFSLDVASGFNYSPEYLLSDSNYLNVIVGRGYNAGGFFTNQTTFYTRGHKFKSIVSAETVGYESAISRPVDFYSISDQIQYGVFTLESSESDGGGYNASFGKIVNLVDNFAMEIIENDKYSPIIHYSEKTDLLREPSIGIDMSIEGFSTNLEGYQPPYGITVGIDAGEWMDLSPFLHKYVIIMLNKEYDALRYYSPHSRFIYSEG